MSPIFPIAELDPRFRLYTAAEAQVEFAVPFPWQNNLDIAVYRIDLDGVQSTLNEAEHYQLTGAGSPTGGTLTLTEGNEALAGEQFLILGDVQLIRAGSIVQGGKFRSRSTDDDLDRMVLIAQEIHRELGRTLRTAYGVAGAEVDVGGDNVLPVWRAGRLEAGPVWGEELGTIVGPGVAAGGTTGQLLRKASGADFHTEWVNGAFTASAISVEPSGGIASDDVQAALAELDTKKLTAVPAEARALLDVAPYVATRAALKAIDTTKDTVAILTEAGRAGTFVWMAADYSAQVTADTAEGIFVKATAVASSAGAWVRVYTGALRPEWFGAIADGATDCRAAIMAALALLVVIGPNGGLIQLSAGTYGISSQITWSNTQHIVFQGVGDASKIKGLGTYSGKYFNLGAASAAGGCGTVLRDFQVIAPAGGSASWVVEAQWMNGMVVERVTTGGTTGGIVMTNCYGVTIQSCTFQSHTAQAIYSLTACHNLVILDNGFYNCAYSSGSQVLRIDVLSYNVIIDNNDFETVGTILNVTDVRSLSFVGNYHEVSTAQLFSFNGTCYNVVVQNNYFSAATNTTTISNVVGLTFIDNAQYNASFVIGSVPILARAGSLESGATLTGIGGTVTQLTSKSTGVTLNKVSGQITTHNASLAAGAEVTFTVTDSAVAATDVVIAHRASGGTAGSYAIIVDAVAAGSFNVTISNLTAGALGEAIVINFAVIKAVAA